MKTHIGTRFRLRHALCFAAAAAIGIMLSVSANAQQLRKFQFGLPVATINSAYCMFPTAMRMGYFAEEGLQATIQNIAGSTSVVQTVLSGSLDVGGATPEPIFKAISEGSPLVMIYDYVRRPTGSVAVPAGSDIREFADLRGKRLGAQSLASGNIMLTNALLSKVGIDPKTEITYLSVGVGGQALQALRSGHVDGLILFDSLYVQMEGMGAKLRYIYGEGQERLFSTQFVMRTETIKEDPDFAVGFGRAIAKATLFARENPEACVRMLWAEFPSSRVAGMPESEQVKNDVAVLKKRMELLIPDDDKGWGRYNEKDVEAWDAFAASGGIIKAPLADLNSVFTNQFVDAFNDFDHQAVVEQAHNWKP